ncbi:aldehyde dehydrogenase [Sphingobium jiangsuense]|uniref:Acyl-CoA reductase-like NAD-dependent aldehyde dehydrogenase n=1 Tax=Sphingobium jiangsuense TaxID=870476 RepID=A0A7W6BRP3_9SPHN|nr:aldehyde dehydrogenase family protein [Sphingobium jiangsuense]MBB3926559.1 acyl-CoA reductase-like NAD-dependent aldehyde dehydrogenase [Sphingobium jiangsuense]GLT02192.1 aldehyde dehydrogenase [Sphingobium jiangsuense]
MASSPFDPALFDSARAQAARLSAHFIDGQWLEAQGGTIPVVNPADESILGHIPAGGAAEVDRAVAAARRAFENPAWAAMPPAQRERLLLRLADLVETHQDELAALETLDNGMPFMASRAMAVGSAISAIRYNAGWPRHLTGDHVPISVPGNWHGYTTHDPLGVAALIVPWNAPFAITCSKLSAALAAGCTVVLKPAELTPLTALRLAQLVQEAGFPDGCVNVVTGLGADAGAALAAHPGVDKISFTGSTATGQHILRQSADTLKRVSLELGGKSAVIVFPDADLERAIPGVAMGIFGNSGQVCAAGSRLFLHEAIFDRFMEGLVAFTQRLKVGDGSDPSVQLGPLISAGQKARVMGYIEAGRAEGASLAVGGDAPSGPGFFVNPTIFIGARPDMKIVREEIFGPVLSVMRFSDDSFDDLARKANDSIYGLSAYLWTRDLARASAMAKRLRSGSVKINGSGMDFALPFGGYRRSGTGRENGREGVEAFTETKAVMIGWTE